MAVVGQSQVDGNPAGAAARSRSSWEWKLPVPRSMNRSASPLVRPLFVVAVLAALPALPARAQPTEAAPAGEATPEAVTKSAAGMRWMFSSDIGYQFAGDEALDGYASQLLLGVRVHDTSQRRDYIEVGIAELNDSEEDALPSYVLVGARSAWTFGRFGLHLFGHLRHGDPSVGDDGEAISSRSAAIGLVASFDVWRREERTLALGVHGMANFHQTMDGGDRSTAFSGSTGLSVMVW